MFATYWTNPEIVYITTSSNFFPEPLFAHIIGIDLQVVFNQLWRRMAVVLVPKITRRNELHPHVGAPP